jgi:hypothetical protein
LPAATFALTTVQPNGFTGILSLSTMTINSGATVSTALEEVTGTTAGTFTITVKAANGIYSGQAQGVANVMAYPNPKIRPL